MRILCQSGPHPAVYRGWKNVFCAAGHESEIAFSLWDPTTKSAFDAFDEANPNLFIAATPPVKSVLKCIGERAPKGMVTIYEYEPESAADTFLYLGAKSDPKLSCDFTYVGSYRSEKQCLLNAYILGMADKGVIKVFGEGPWPTPYHLGYVEEDTLPSIYASAKVCLNISTEGRTNDRIYNSILAGSVCVTNYLKESPIPNDIAIRSLTPGEFQDNAVSIALDPKLTKWRSHARDRGYALILEKHTYWHRAEALFRRAGFDREADKIMEQYHATVGI